MLPPLVVIDGYDSGSKSRKIQRGVRSLVNEIYLDDLREKTHRGLSGQALRGLSAGGKTYGYRAVPIEDSTRKDAHGRPEIVGVRREVDKEQATIVRMIYEWYADGLSPLAITHKLNEIGVLSPRGGKWARSAIQGDKEHGTGLLNNLLYVGKYVWNRSE